MDPKEIAIQSSVKSWQIQVDRLTRLVNELTDDQLIKEIAPGKNRGIYLIGHLAAVSDAMPEILGLGKKQYPALAPMFLEAPDKTIENIPSVSELRHIWTTVHERLQKEFSAMPADNWFARHQSMTDADFEKDPTRNKLSVLLNRTNHFSYHYGQLRLLK